MIFFAFFWGGEGQKEDFERIWRWGGDDGGGVRY